MVGYLEHLQFDPKLLRTLPGKYLGNIRLVLLLILLIVVIGVFSFIQIPRRLNPEIKIPIVSVTTVLPGASPQDVETLVTDPIEDKLQDVKGVDVMTSVSSENASSVVIQFLSSVNTDKARNDVQTAVDSVTDLPTDAKTPVVTLFDFEDQPIWTFAILTKSDPGTLMRFSKQLEKKIKDNTKVDKVSTSGFFTQEVQVVIDQTRVQEYGIDPDMLSQAMRRATNSYPAGSLKTASLSFLVAIDKDVTTIEDIRNIRITTKTQSIRLADIATIEEHPEPNVAKTLFTDRNTSPKLAVQFFVYKTSISNIDDAEKSVRKDVEEMVKGKNNRFQLVTITNFAEEINRQFDDLFSEFRSTIFLVFILLLVFLGLRQAIISSITVPLTFLSAFTIIYMLGLSLNFLTSFAFLIALGLLIDDTIVVVAAMTRYYKTGRFTPKETGILVWKDFIVPLWSTTITTIWAFVPLLLASGIIGEFIKSIPIVVTATMLSSTTIAVFITLPLMIVFLKPQFPRRVKISLIVFALVALFAILILVLPKNYILPFTVFLFALLLGVIYLIREQIFKTGKTFVKTHPNVKQVYHRSKKVVDNGIFDIELLSKRYMVVIDKILQSRSARRNTILAITVFAILGYLLVPLGLVTNEFFPKTDEALLYVSVELPQGTTLETTNREMISLLSSIRKTEVVNFAVGEAGSSFDPNYNRSQTTNSFLITLHLPRHTERKVSSQDLAQRIRDKYKDYRTGTLSVQEVSGGPPAGADVQIKLLGDDLGALNSYADKIAVFLRKEQRVTNVQKSVKPGTSKLTFVPDNQKIADANLTVDQIASWLHSFASGSTLDTIKLENNEDADIVFRFSQKDQSPESLSSLVIPTSSGGIPLLSLGSLKLEDSPTQITHEDGKRTLSVSASSVKDANVAEINKKVETFANSLHLPAGYTWATGGVNEENQKSIQSIIQAMIISFLLILVTMVIEFGSFRQALIAILLIPIAVSSVFYVFALTATPLSFPALIGILALFGIVVTHAIVVIEKINDNRREGMPIKTAIVDAAGHRLEPVLLTSLATMVGLIPITLADPLWRGLGGAIIAGLIFSGAIKLFFIPVLYYNWFRGEEKPRSV